MHNDDDARYLIADSGELFVQLRRKSACYGGIGVSPFRISLIIPDSTHQLFFGILRSGEVVTFRRKGIIIPTDCATETNHLTL